MRKRTRKSQEQTIDRWEVAYHEAGHIISDYLHGFSLYVVKIGNHHGHVAGSRVASASNLREAKQTIRARVVSLYAGIEAQKLFNNSADESRARSDFATAVRESWNEGLFPRSRASPGDQAHLKYLH